MLIFIALSSTFILMNNNNKMGQQKSFLKTSIDQMEYILAIITSQGIF